MDTDISDFFQKVIEHTAESIFLINAAGTVVFAAQESNKKFEGKVFLKAISKIHHKRIQKTITDAFSSKRATTCELRGWIGVSRSAWFSCRISPVLKNNEVSSALVFASDITKRRAENLAYKKKLQKKFHKSNKRTRAVENILTMCPITKKVQFKDQWLSIENFLWEQYGFKISHGISPEANKAHFKIIDTVESRQKTTQGKIDQSVNQTDSSQLEDMIAVDEQTLSIEEIDLMLKDENLKKTYEEKFQNRLYSQILLSLTHEIFTEADAKVLWKKIVCHMQDLNKKLGRKVGISVATMDYLSNISDSLSEPKIIEENKSNFVAETSTGDELTGLYLRGVFNVVLEKEIEKANRKGTPVCLMMIDIDDFKFVNDKYGHQTGDDVLAEIGKIISSSIRDMDCAARYGGEEFAIVMPDTKTQDAYEAAQRIRKSVMGKQFSGFNVTVSIGLACSGKNSITPEEVVKTADDGLYKSKKNGKNMVTISHS